MSTKTLAVTDRIHDYLLQVTLRETPLMKRLRDETAAMPMSRMQISPEQGQLMGLLVELLGARRCIEVGVFTGYSALSVAQVLPEEGRIVACDVSEEWTAIARRYWDEAGVTNKIDLRLAPATATLEQLLQAGEAGSFDFSFIDADKTNYDAYYELSLKLLRPGGLIAVDNALWGGDVADPTNTESDTQAIRALNAKVAADQRVSMSLVPIGDGVLLARKR